MQRRDTLLALIALGTAPLVVRAQQGNRVRRVGVLMGGLSSSDLGGQSEAAALKLGLIELGWIEGRNLEIADRWPGGEPDRIQAAAKELIELRCEVIVARSTPGVAALLKEKHTIPIVFAIVVDPVGSGFVASLARPGGNVTGFQNYEFTMAGKWVQLIREIAPQLQRIAYPYNPATIPTGFLRSLEAVASSFSVQLIAAPVHDSTGIDAAVAALARKPGGGLMLLPDIFLLAHRVQIVGLAAKYGLPAIYTSRLWPSFGGLMAYGPDSPDLFRRAAAYVDRILKGEKPDMLPVQMANKYSLVINLKTAKSLGLKVPQSLLARADEIIQ